MFKLGLNWSVLQLSKIRPYTWVRLTQGQSPEGTVGTFHYVTSGAVCCAHYLACEALGYLSFFGIGPYCLNPKLKLECPPGISWERTALALLCLEGKHT